MKIFGRELKFNDYDIWHKGNFNPDIDTQNIPFIVGTQTATTSLWTGIANNIESLVDGTTIRYWLPRTSSSTSVTLNLTLKGGIETGAINCYYQGTTRLTTHYPAGSLILLTYVVDQLINGTSYTGWWAHGQYYSDTYTRTYWSNTITAGATIYSYKILMQAYDGRFYPLTLETGTGITKTISTQEFVINCPILYYNTTTTVSTGSTLTNVYSEIPMSYLNYTANQASWTSQRNIYLKGKINSNGNFVLDNTSYTSFMTQTLPTTEDGFVYILLGYMYSTTAIRLFQYHPIYEFKDGRLKEYVAEHTHNKSDIGLNNVNNTADSEKNVLSATKLTTARTINGVSFNGTQNITIIDSTKEPIISSGTVSQFFSGTKTWRDLAVDVRAIVLTGLSTSTNAAITATDSILSALGKLQKQITDHLNDSVKHVTTTERTNWNSAQKNSDITKAEIEAKLTGTITTHNHTVTKADVGLGNVTNESKTTMFTSPTFTGTPTAPTPTSGDNSTKIATTAYVQSAMASAGTGDMLKSVYDKDNDGIVDVAKSLSGNIDGGTF